jgi:hypothetical protein
MKTWLSVCGVVAIAAPIALAAQGTAPEANASAETPQVVTMTMVSTIRHHYTSAKSTLTKMADLMPAESYSFQPTPAMRTYAGAMGHIIMGNITQCGSLLGKKHALSGVDLSKSLTVKADVVKAMSDSFAFCDEYFSPLDDKSDVAGTFVDINGRRNGQPTQFKVSNGAIIIDFLDHNNEMYGYLSVYLRLKGLVPPQSVPQTSPAGRGRGGSGGGR